MPRRPVWEKAFLETLEQTANVKLACSSAGVSRAVVYRRRARNPEFSAKWGEAVDQAVELLEAEARRRAAVGVEEPVYYQGAVVGHVRKYSDVLLIFLLKAHRPRVYRDHVAG